MLKPGDRCVFIGIGIMINGPLCGQPTPFKHGDIVTLFGLHTDGEWIVYYYQDGSHVRVPERLLKKIDDNDDEIPADIRAIFDDKCDETLPRPERVSHD